MKPILTGQFHMQHVDLFMLIPLYSLYLEYVSPLIISASGLTGLMVKLHFRYPSLPQYTTCDRIRLHQILQMSNICNMCGYVNLSEQSS
jgi:hypothetical protein